MSQTRTYYKTRNEFSELHYLLPRESNMFDFDLFASTNDSTIYLESNCNFDAGLQDRFNLDKFKPLALFEYKHDSTPAVKKSLELPIYTSVWSAFMTAKMLNIRFFIVIATNGTQPFYIFEYDRAGKIIMQGSKKYKVLQFVPEQKETAVNEFWKNELKLI